MKKIIRKANINFQNLGSRSIFPKNEAVECPYFAFKSLPNGFIPERKFSCEYGDSMA